MEAGNSHRQLAAIEGIHRALLAANLPHWLTGGWAVDFTLGKETRAHSDIEFAVWKRDWPRVERTLAALGFAHGASPHPDETRTLMLGDSKCELYLLERTRSGEVVIGGRWAHWPFPPGSWGEAVGVLGGLSIPIMSAEGLLDSKEGWPNQPLGGPLREKDIHDINLLKSYLAHHKAHGGKD